MPPVSDTLELSPRPSVRLSDRTTGHLHESHTEQNRSPEARTRYWALMRRSVSSHSRLAISGLPTSGLIEGLGQPAFLPPPA